MKRIGICIAGLNGAVASTIVAGVTAIRRHLTLSAALISDSFADANKLASLDSFIFGGWDIRGETVFESCRRHRVVESALLVQLTDELGKLKPWPPKARQLTRDIEMFRRRSKLDTVVVLNLLPTGRHAESRAYALAAAKTGSPFINFTPNDCGETSLTQIPYCGKDGKTGQTWIKTVIAPALLARGLRVTGWYSTNLLGNEDGRVVGDPRKGKAKIHAKTKLLSEMLGYDVHHQVQINFYPPRGDNKESWDTIDFTGFLGMPMQLKVNGLWRDSILAAPMCIDLVRFVELAHRRGEHGLQEWLSFYFKSPYARHPKNPPPHDAFQQHQMLCAYLRETA